MGAGEGESSVLSHPITSALCVHIISMIEMFTNSRKKITKKDFPLQTSLKGESRQPLLTETAYLMTGTLAM